MELVNCEQGSPEWFAARLGMPTASEFKAVLAKGQGKTRKSYMMKLLGERLTGQPADSYTNGHMERGKEMEDEARRMYAFMRDVEPTPVGFVRNGGVGASPDALIGDAGLLEIKTKAAHLQAELLLADRVPPEHLAQTQGQIWVAEREWCDFVSYWPGMYPFIKRVFRDEKYIETLAAEVGAFTEELDKLEAKIRKQYGDDAAVQNMAAG